MLLVNSVQIQPYNKQKSQNRNSQTPVNLNYSPNSISMPGLHQVRGLYFSANLQTANEIKNEKLSALFDDSYKKGDMSKLIQYIDTNLPSITGGNTAQSEQISAQVSSRGHIQITGSSFGHVFPVVDELGFMTGDGFDPKELIANGIRGLDPAPQSKWKDAPLGKEWPPSGSQHVTHKVDNKTGSVLFDAKENPDYKVKTIGMARLNPEDGSLIWAYQQENLNPDIKWAAWTIAPFRVPEGKKALGIFPVSNEFKSNYSEILQENNQWQLDKKNNMVMIKPNEDGGFFDPSDSKPNWCAFAVEGSNKVMVMRSIYKEPFEDKFKACALESNVPFIEMEFMAPKVKQGKKSTIACKIDFVPLSKMGIEKFKKDDMEEQMQEVSNYLKNKLD